MYIYGTSVADIVTRHEIVTKEIHAQIYMYIRAVIFKLQV